VVLPTYHQPAKMMEPCKESFHAPTSAVVAQGTNILSWLRAFPAMRCDQLNAVRQVAIQSFTFVSFVADQSCREGVSAGTSVSL